MEKEEITTNDYLKGIVLNLPDSPGIYQYLNSEGTIIYVGKAKNLKRRVSSYFNREHPNGKTRLLVSRYPLYRGKNRRRRPFTRKQPDKEIQATLQCIAER